MPGRPGGGRLAPLRIGIVNYINSRPLAWGLVAGDFGDRYEVRLLPPAAIAAGLAAGDLDAGLVPSIELARIPGLARVPGLAIAALHEVRSVLLVSRVPIAGIRRVALDENSRTSAVLVRLVLAERYGLAPEFVDAPPRLESMLDAADAALVIGDPALAVERETFVVLDLAGEWLEMTGLPFVFAVWAARPGVAMEPLASDLATSFDRGLAALPDIVARAAAETGIASAVLHDYYTRNLRFRMGAAEEAGLSEFLRRARVAGYAPSAPPAG